MTAIDQKLQKLREQEKQLQLEKKKIEFLTHILSSSKDYNHPDFSEIKESVISMLSLFIDKAIGSIESGTELSFENKKEIIENKSEPIKQESSKNNVDRADPMISAHEKASFALDNRHLAGKVVSIENDKNLVVKGTVVGLDAPFVLVKTETGPIIKVPLNKVSIG